MPKRSESTVLVVIDFLMINLAFLTYYWLRIESGIIAYAIQPDFLLPMFVIYIYWLVWFGIFGLYRSWYAQSRLDEIMTLFRASSVGVLLLFFVIFLDDEGAGVRISSRILIAAYWAMFFGFVSTGRMTLRALQKSLLKKGIGARNTLIVGFSEKAFELCDMVMRFPELGYRVTGFVLPSQTSSKPIRKNEHRGVKVLGRLKELPALLKTYETKEVLIGLDSTEHDKLLEVIRYCNGHDVGMKIIPDLYDIVSGQARLSSIYGFPLIEVKQQLMKPWEEVAKRFVDVVISSLILLVGMPVWMLVSMLIKLDSRGPIFYRQERVGRNGQLFPILKFRSMVAGAEEKSGPKWAERNDPRVTRIGKLLRKMHLDEVPQLINVLRGEMSLVGPRPERQFFVEKLSKQLPLYQRRLRVRPGITGWAQVKHTYDRSIEDVKEKVKYDLFYIENMSWRFDMKILLMTLKVMLMGKGHA